MELECKEAPRRIVWVEDVPNDSDVVNLEIDGVFNGRVSRKGDRWAVYLAGWSEFSRLADSKAQAMMFLLNASGCVPVEPAPKAAAIDLDTFANAINNASQEASDQWNAIKAAASTSVDAPKLQLCCQRCSGTGSVSLDIHSSVCGICDGTGKAPAEPSRKCIVCESPVKDYVQFCSQECLHKACDAPAEPEKPRRSWADDAYEVLRRNAVWFRRSNIDPQTGEELARQIEVFLSQRELPTAPLDDAGLDRLINRRISEWSRLCADRNLTGDQVRKEAMRAVLREYAAMGYPEVK